MFNYFVFDKPFLSYVVQTHYEATSVVQGEVVHTKKQRSRGHVESDFKDTTHQTSPSEKICQSYLCSLNFHFKSLMNNEQVQ